MRKWKGSYTVEASIIVPLAIGVLALAMKMGISCYQEIRREKEQERIVELWEVQDFYRNQMRKEIIHDQS